MTDHTPLARRRRAPRISAVICAAWYIGGGLVPAVAAPKTDVIVFRNGDRLTGEIKQLEHGKLDFETDATGTISIEWDEISTLQTEQYLQVETVDGLRYVGPTPHAGDPGNLVVKSDARTAGTSLALPQVVRIATIDKGNVLERLDGYVTAGFDYTKANELKQFNFTGGLKSRSEVRQWSIDGSSTVTSQEGTDDSSRFDVSAQNRRFLAERWFVQGFGGFEANDELGLDLRSTLGAAYGRYLRQTNQRDWAAYAGLAVTRENYTGEDVKDSIEGVLGTQFSYFRYDSPEASLDFAFNVLPSLTEAGRVRAESKLRSRYEIVTDLFFDVSLYGSYDSDPGKEAISNADYGVVTSLGYSF